MKTFLSGVKCVTSLIFALAASALLSQVVQSDEVPADKFDLSQWNITLPLDDNNDDKVDIVSVKDLQKYSHPDFFYLDDEGYMVFTAPNKAFTTPNSTNTRSELRQMQRGTNTRINTKDPRNNWSIAINPHSDKFASVGGKMEATLKVNHVAKRAGNPEKNAAYSMVIGQIHAGTYDPPVEGFGWGNEPLKIFYKKWPEHETGSVFWTYEKNLPRHDPNRKDVVYPVWGYTWENPEDPGESGVPLGEEFSYTVNVHGDIMHLTFEAPGRETVNYSLNLGNAVDAYGNLDPHDHKWGYGGDWMYFKAGAYNQCSTRDAEGMWYAACLGTGEWEVDKANGDYASASFSRLVLSESEPPAE